MPIKGSFRLVSRDWQPQDTVVKVGSAQFGGGFLPIIGGPCAVEGAEGFLEAAEVAKAAGATVLRGGAYKPRSSPYSFQGLEEEGLKILAQVGEAVGLPTCTEVMAPELVPLVAQYADLLQVGTRNAQNFPLLKALGEVRRPVLLKRGFGCTVEEWLQSAEYIMAGGNTQVILCERGLRTFDSATRFCLDLGGVVAAKQVTHLPVVVDPSHAAGQRDLVTALARAATAAGCDGLLIEVHPQPETSASDAAQALTPEMFRRLVDEVRAVSAALGRTVPRPFDVAAGD